MMLLKLSRNNIHATNILFLGKSLKNKGKIVIFFIW